MKEGLINTIRWFADNLDWWLEDQFLTDERVDVDLYFDSVDISKTIEGMRRYYTGADDDDHSFNLEDVFDVNPLKPLRDNVLVHCLAFSGRLGAIKMLTPHQAELHNLIQYLEKNEVKQRPYEMTRQFLKVACETAHIKYENKSLQDLDEAELRKFVRQYTGAAVDLFKIIQLIRGGLWQKRLGNLYNKGLLKLEHPKEKYDEIMKSDDFWKIKKAFDEKRPHLRKSRNNFADAVSICILIDRVKQFTTQQSNRLPRFFTSSRTFFEVIEETGAEASMGYQLANGIRSNPLRKADYFVFKCIFSESKDVPGLKNQVGQMLKNPDLLSEDATLTSGRPLGEIVSDLNRLSFFENVWRCTVEEQEVPQIVNDLSEAAQLVEKFVDPRFKHEVTESYQIVRKEFEEKSVEYQQISELWHEVEQAAADLQEQVDKRSQIVSFFREFGLFRFGFHEHARERIEAVLIDLLAAQEEEKRHARLVVVTAYHRAHEDPERYLDQVNAAVSVLWVTERYRQLVELLDQVKPLPHYSLTLIYAAAAFASELQHHTGLAKKALDTLKELEESYQQATDLETRANLAVGIAYLLFRKWRYYGGRASWREQPELLDSSVSAELQDTVNQAIEVARQASVLCRQLGQAPGVDTARVKEKEAYALNQYLYYLVEGGTPERRQEMERAATKLLNYNQGPVWQYRFDDTLARYYHRLAIFSKKKMGRRLEQARVFIERAKKAAPWDRDIKIYHDQLIHIIFG
jgi:hypothetical protein